MRKIETAGHKEKKNEENIPNRRYESTLSAANETLFLDITAGRCFINPKRNDEVAARGGPICLGRPSDIVTSSSLIIRSAAHLSRHPFSASDS